MSAKKHSRNYRIDNNERIIEFVGLYLSVPRGEGSRYLFFARSSSIPDIQ